MSGLIAKYPEFLQGSAEFLDIQQALEPECLALWQAEEGLLAQLCVDTATWGLRYWEQALGIAVEVEKDVEYRRSRVRSKLRGAGVTTVAMIQEVSESFSNGEVAVTEYAEQYKLEIKFVGTVGMPPNMSDLTAALREILPAHLAWEYIYIYNTWDAVKLHTWGDLSAYTWAQVKESELNADN